MKRGIVSMISTIYNPSWIYTPALLKPKKIIQGLWKDKTDMDDTIPHQLPAQWNTWKQDLENITKMLNNEFGFHKENNNDVELHVFCDAYYHIWNCSILKMC